MRLITEYRLTSFKKRGIDLCHYSFNLDREKIIFLNRKSTELTDDLTSSAKRANMNATRKERKGLTFRERRGNIKPTTRKGRKKMENRIIENLELFGGRRFTNGGMDRMYFGENVLGSKAEASRNFINLKTGEVYSTAKGEEKKEMKEKLMKLLRDATESTEAMISLPSTDRALKNLVNMVKRYGRLLKKATGFSDLRITQDGLVFEGMDAENEAHRLLLEYMKKFVEANKGIREKEELQTDNEKFAFRTWLIRLGWKGREASKLRTSLYE